MTLSQIALYALGGVALLTFLSLIVLVLTWAERKALAGSSRLSKRRLPTRLKLHSKEQPLDGQEDSFYGLDSESLIGSMKFQVILYQSFTCNSGLF